MQDVDWSDFQAFLAISRAGTLARAGAALGVDPTTIGRHVRRLEQRLNARLLERTRQGQVLTEEGEKLLNVVETMANAASSLTDEQGLGEGLAGIVRLSVSEGFGSWVISRKIGEFARAHPALQIDLVASSGFLSPSRREADIAVMLSRPKSGPVLARKLSDYSLRLYGSCRYLSQCPEIRTFSDLAADHNLVGYIPDLLYSPELHYLAELDPSLSSTIRSSSIIAQYQMIREGAGIGVLPCFIGDSDPALAPLFPDKRITRSFWLVTHKDTQQLGRITACKEWLLRVASQERAVLLPD